ncbi:hypothetical protein NAL32_07595 [Chryseobacterium sp. Ch-15]|nr:hypothetical protein [Chryseobacterium muglaense]MCC9032687.1 hypothetical protein [Chryseobacterium muglaense]MCM2554256.1 hypothetical protein [Chryseobacterium muglaense]
MNIKHLTEYLMSYVSAMQSNNEEETDRLMKEISLIFDKLQSVTSNETKKEEIINLILLKIKEKTLSHFDVANYTMEFVLFGFR